MLLPVGLLLLFLSCHSSQTIKHLHEISIDEEIPIGSVVTSLTDKIPNLDQSIEYDLVTPVSADLDLFAIDHHQHALVSKARIDYETLCSKKSHVHRCLLSVSIAVSNEDTIDVYILPVHLININDNLIRFPVNRTVIEIEENDDDWFQKSYSLPRASDDDGDSITYSVFLHNWQKPVDLFEFDESSLSLRPLRKFDREEQNIYLLRLIAHNQNDLSIDIIILIKDQNDNAPVCQSTPTVFLITNMSSVSTLTLNATDLDEGDNSKLEYHLVTLLPGFTIDRSNGQIKFDAKKWNRSNQSILAVNVTDHGKPVRLATQCLVEIKFTSLFHIDFRSNRSMINQTHVHLDVENIYLPLGHLAVNDKQDNRTCTDCSIHLTSSRKDIVSLNDSSFDVHLNLNSILLMRILTNALTREETITFTVHIDVFHANYSSLMSSKNYSFSLHFNKPKLFLHSNTLFVKLQENLPLNHRLPLFTHEYYCFKNRSNSLALIDPSHTFDVDPQFNLVLRKYLNTKQRHLYRLTLLRRDENRTRHVSVHRRNDFADLTLFSFP